MHNHLDKTELMRYTLPEQIVEFLQASRSSYSYNCRKNLYILFGILWGIPIPLVTIALQVHYLQDRSIPQSLLSALQTPLQWFFLAHPVIFAVIFGVLGTIRHQKNQELNQKIQQLKDLTTHDPLTGLKNRRYFANTFHDECARSLRRQESLALLFLDIDHFKLINDKHGHYIGDMVLREVGKFLRLQCRPYDTPVRWGGEEFLLLLRATDETAAVHSAERIRAAIEKGCSSKISIPFTISIGLAEHEVNDTLEQLTDRADQALYHAKQLGRNRVVSWSSLREFRKIANE